MKMKIFYLFPIRQYRWNEIDRGKPKYSENILPSATLSTINPT
jgi:hypothetical protein